MLKLRSPRSKNNAGFSLPELLIVMVMVGVLAMIATPSWLGVLNGRRANVVQNDIVQSIRQAQNQAMRQRTPQSFTLTAAANQLPLLQVQGQANERAGGDGLPANLVTVTTIPNNNPLVITYNESGAVATIPATPTRIQIQVGSSRRCISIENLLGTVRTLDGTCPNP